MAKKKSSKPAKIKNRLTAAQALTKLHQGNERFIAHDPINYQTEAERIEERLDEGQKPYAVILNCADSRVSPEIMFNTGLNELFVLRVAGNVADTCTIASIEYAVTELNTNLIVVMGHEKCGAVKAALANAEETCDLGYNLNSLIAHMTPGVAAAKKKKASFAKDPVAAAVKANAHLNALELRRRSPIITATRGVEIVWGYYNLISGKAELSEFLPFE